MITIAPSFLASDWKKVESEISNIEKAGAEWIHLDVMDGQFVPQITFGPQMVKAIKECTKLPLDVHLMIENPEQQIDSFIEAGADIITIHNEASKHLHRTVQDIKSKGAKAGVAINPGTPASVLESIIAEINLALVMTVNPGWGGQKFIENCLGKITQIKALASNKNPNISIQVDGGINEKTGAQVVEAGANVLVAGTYVFGAKDRAKAISSLKNLNCSSC